MMVKKSVDRHLKYKSPFEFSLTPKMCTVLNVGLAWKAVAWAGSCVFSTEALLGGGVELLGVL